MADKDPKLTGTARVGFEPKIEQPVKDIELDIGDLRGPDGILRSPDELDKVAEEDGEAINEFFAGNDEHAGFEEVQNEINGFDRELDNRLKDMEIKYDPEEFPQLHDAQQHICGRPGSTNVITYRDLQNRWALERAQTRRSLGVPTTLDDMDLNGSGIQAKQEKFTAKSIAQMLALVLRQILIWVLEFFLRILSPLKKIKFVKKIPQAFQRAINRLRGGGNVFSGPDSIFDQFGEDIQQQDESDINSEDLARAGGGFISSPREITDEIFESLPPECLAHTPNWLQAVDRLITDNPRFASAYYGKKINNEVQRRMSSLNKIAALGIPNGHVITRRNGSSLTYSNPLPEEYLQARADGSTRFRALRAGAVKSVTEVANSFLPRMRRLIANIASDPRLFCCLIRNLTIIANTQKLRRVLLMMQALLQVARNLFALDIAKELGRLGNLVIDLLNSILQTIFSAFTTFFYNALTKNAMKISDWAAMGRVSPECRPWNELLNLIIEIATDMLRRVLEYLASFFKNFSFDIKRLSATTDKSSMLAFIDRLLNIINTILKFSAAWAACIEDEQDPLVILSGGDRLRIDETGITLGPKAATSSSGGGIKGTAPGTDSREDVIFSTTPGSSTQGQGQGLSAEGPFSNAGLKILLTNFLGVDDKTANEVVKNIQDDDCSCDKSLTPDELATLENLIKERT